MAKLFKKKEKAVKEPTKAIFKTKDGKFKIVEKGKSKEVSRDEVIAYAKKNKLELQYE